MLFASVFLIFPLKNETAIAAPISMPLKQTTNYTQHTPATTHQMRVFDNGRITDHFLNDLSQNQIDQDHNNPDATTIAVVFRQHQSNDIDVGADDDFIVTTPIALHNPSTIAPYSEDSIVVYENKDPVIPYQITQQTFAIDSVKGNWLIMQFTIRNLGQDGLTDGKFMLMLDMDVAKLPKSDSGYYDKSRNLIYSSDISDGVGYAMGVSLLNRTWAGFGINGNEYPNNDDKLIEEIQNPQDSVVDGKNNVSWIIVDVPKLGAGEEEVMSFGLCAVAGDNEPEATENLIECFNNINEPSQLKLEKNGPTDAQVGEPVTYTINVSHTPDSNRSPIEILSVEDDVAGRPELPRGGDINNNGKLDFGETWHYLIDYTISPTDDNFLINTAKVRGFIANSDDTGGKVITATVSHVTDVEFLPSLSLKLTPNNNGTDDEVENYVLSITNDSSTGDGSPMNITSISVANDVIGDPFAITLGNCLPIGKTELLGGESLECTFNFTSNSDQLNLVTGTITGIDKDNEAFNKEVSYRKCCLAYLPVIFKPNIVQPPPPPQCNNEIVYDPFDPNLPRNWRELLEANDLVLRYLDGGYQMYAKDPIPLFYEIRKGNSIYDNYKVVVDSHWVESEDATSGEGIGIIFNYNVNTNNKVNAYIFLVDTYASRYNLARYLDASPADTPVSLTGGWTNFPSICLNGGRLGTNTLAVMRKQNKIDLYINECAVDTVNDNVIPNGQIGLAVQGFWNHPVFGSPKADGRFDDFHIYRCGDSQTNLLISGGNSQTSNILSRAK